jgi:hypothetical protein
MDAAFESGRTEDWRSLAEANRLTDMSKHARNDALQGTNKSQLTKRKTDAVEPNVFGAKNLAIVAVLIAGGYILDSALAGRRVDGGKGGPFRRMVDAILSPARRLMGKGGPAGSTWKRTSPAEMARLAAEKRHGSATTKKKKSKGKKKR